MSKAKNFLPLEDAVKFWADRIYDDTATRKQRKLKEKKDNRVALHIDWSKVKFTDVTSWPPLADDNKQESNDVKQMQNDVAHQFGPAVSSAPSAAILFQTRFTNNTKDVQEYTMRTEKTTRSSMSTEVHQGYTKGFDMSVTLKTPCEIFEANAGYHSEVSLTNCDGESFEEEVSWGVESLIRVKPEHVAEAQLVVNERKQCGRFEIESRISGMVYVTFTNVKDNNSFVKSTGHAVDEIVKDYLERERKKFSEYLKNIVTIEDRTVVVRTAGSCRFRYGVKQDVRVDQKPIDSKKLP